MQDLMQALDVRRRSISYHFFHRITE